MKLTHEGAARLGRHESRGFPVGDFEFRPEDFQGAVILSVEEAKAICDYARDFYVHQSRVSDDFEQLHSDIKERIKQVEIKHLKREIAQLKKEQARDNLEIKRLEERYKNLTYSVLEQVGTEKCDG